MQKLEYSFGELRTYSVDALYLRNRGLSEPVHRAELFQQRLLAIVTYTRTIVENAFCYTLLHEKLMVSVREAMTKA